MESADPIPTEVKVQASPDLAILNTANDFAPVYTQAQANRMALSDNDGDEAPLPTPVENTRAGHMAELQANNDWVHNYARSLEIPGAVFDPATGSLTIPKETLIAHAQSRIFDMGSVPEHRSPQTPSQPVGNYGGGTPHYTPPNQVMTPGNPRPHPVPPPVSHHYPTLNEITPQPKPHIPQAGHPASTGERLMAAGQGALEGAASFLNPIPAIQEGWAAAKDVAQLVSQGHSPTEATLVSGIRHAAPGVINVLGAPARLAGNLAATMSDQGNAATREALAQKELDRRRAKEAGSDAAQTGMLIAGARGAMRGKGVPSEKVAGLRGVKLNREAPGQQMPPEVSPLEVSRLTPIKPGHSTSYDMKDPRGPQRPVQGPKAANAEPLVKQSNASRPKPMGPAGKTESQIAKESDAKNRLPSPDADARLKRNDKSPLQPSPEQAKKAMESKPSKVPDMSKGERRGLKSSHLGKEEVAKVRALNENRQAQRKAQKTLQQSKDMRDRMKERGK